LFYHLQRDHRFSEPRSRFYTAEMASAIGYLYLLNIVYRDLKPETVLLDSEVLKKQPCDRTVDWWCLGTVFYEIIYGLNVSEMYDSILHRPLSLPVGTSSVVCDMLMGLLQKDQHRRLVSYTYAQLKVKKPNFFSPINWDDLYYRRITPPYNPNV
ncbi:unnamed protein product, partial [Coregonus sp. 'balchen']